MRTHLDLEALITISECLDMRLKISNVIEPDSDTSRISDLKTFIDASISAEINSFKLENQN